MVAGARKKPSPITLRGAGASRPGKIFTNVMSLF
jgi:hypothetical protein